MIHLTSVYKVDIFVARPGPWQREEFARRQELAVGPDPAAPTVYFSSAEDVVLHKLVWYRDTGATSDPAEKTSSHGAPVLEGDAK